MTFKVPAYLFNVVPGFHVAPEEADRLLGLGETLDLVGHDQRNLWKVVNSVTWNPKPKILKKGRKTTKRQSFQNKISELRQNH